MFNFFHICNHEVRRKNVAPELREIAITSSGNNIDLIIDGGIVVGIESVRAITYKDRVTKDIFEYDNTMDNQTYEDKDEEDGYYDGAEKYFIDYSKFKQGENIPPVPVLKEYYETYLHNRIKWNVEPPLTYIVAAYVLFSNKPVETFSLIECPRCQGNGWFVDILNSKGSFSESEGIMKITQNVIKDLLTEYQSNVLNLQYGTLIKSTISSAIKEDDLIFDEIKLIVSEVEDRYLLRQQEEYESLAADERLVNLWVRNISRSKVDVRKIVLEIEIRTEESEQIFRFSI